MFGHATNKQLKSNENSFGNSHFLLNFQRKKKGGKPNRIKTTRCAVYEQSITVVNTILFRSIIKWKCTRHKNVKIMIWLVIVLQSGVKKGMEQLKHKSNNLAWMRLDSPWQIMNVNGISPSQQSKTFTLHVSTAMFQTHHISIIIYWTLFTLSKATPFPPNTKINCKSTNRWTIYRIFEILWKITLYLVL